MRAGRLRSWIAWAPVACVAVFVILYAVAAWLYPGGTRGAPATVGYRFLDNYWCDLMDVVTYGGRPNPARPVAIAATTILCAGLGVLWWIAPALYPDAPKRAILVRLTGLSSGALTPLIASRFHDTVIDVAALLGMLALATTMSALRGRGGRTLAVAAWCALVLACLNYGAWRLRIGLSVLPAIQKAAFAAFLSWVVVLARRTAAEFYRCGARSDAHGPSMVDASS